MSDQDSAEPQVPDDRGAQQDLLAELAEDFTRRCRAGESPFIEEYIRNHPELAGEIADVFPALLAMEQSGLSAAPTSRLENVGATIGRYKLLERIGEGGFGVVFMAEQQFPVRRKVALKVIKPGMDTRQVIARFEAERQALAMMDHPNIAKVLDAGATESGRPYFVMELVPGIPITEYCDRERMAPRERLELFVQVCQAVQHAHTKGIIHRDLKPTNVLVAVHDGVLVPKVIDFGVAKATGGAEHRLTDRTLFTQFVQMVGTPLYMSPEQAQMGGLDVDTRSDVYSLGVLLYELLTGSTPFDSNRLGQAAIDELRRIIREEEPPKPSTRLSTSVTLPAIAASRGLEPGRLSALVRGELDWIAMKALEKDRARRYETVNGLAMDVQRYLNDETVQACPPSRSYRLRKFARRNKATLLIASVSLMTLLVLVVGLAVSNRLIAAQRNEKAEALNAKEEALALATAESNRSRKNFMAASVAIREVITKAALGADDWAQLTPALRAKLSDEALKFYGGLLHEESPAPSLRYETAVGYRSIALFHSRAGNRQRAEECYRKAITILEEISSAAPAELQYRQQLAYAHQMLGGLLVQGGRTREAEEAFLKSSGLYVGLLTDVPDSAEYRGNLASCLTAWQAICIAVPYQQFLQGAARLPVQRARAEFLTKTGHTAEAVQLYRELAAECDKLAVESPSLPEYRFTQGICEFQVGQLMGQTGRSAEAEQAYLRSIAVLRPIAREYPAELKYRSELGRSHNWLASVLNSMGRRDEAEQEHRQAVQIYTELVKLADPVAGHWHKRELGWSHLNLGSLLSSAHRMVEAEPEFRAAMALFEVLAPQQPTDPAYRNWMRDLSRRLGLACAATGRGDEARDWFHRGSELAGDDPAAREELAAFFLEQGMLAEAEAEARQVIRLNSSLPSAHCRLSQVLLRAGKRREAEGALQEANRLLSEPVAAAILTPGRRESNGHTLWQLGDAWLQLGRPKEAEAAYVDALSTFQHLARQFPDNPFYQQEQGNSHWRVADAMERADRMQDAESHLRQAMKLYEGLMKGHPEHAFYRQELGFSHRKMADLTERAGRRDETEAHLREALGCYQQLVSDTPDSAFYRQEAATVGRRLANLLRAHGRPAEAGRALDGAIAQLSAVLAKQPEALEVRRERRFCYMDNGNFAAAVEDSSQLLRMRPQVSWYWCDRGWAYHLMGEHEKSVADLTRAIELLDAATERHMRGEAYRALGRWQEAETDFSRAIELRPDWESWNRRGQLYAQLSRWDKAAEDLSQAARLAPGQITTSYYLALAYLAQEDQAGYREACVALLDRASRNPDTNTAFWAAWTCVLAPSDGIDAVQVIELAERAVAANPARGDYLSAHGAALYRAGRYEEAVKRLVESEAAFATHPGGATVAYGRLFLAMAHQRLGLREEAHRWLDNAVQAIEPSPASTQPQAASPPWNRALTLRLLRREAEDLLKSNSRSSNKIPASGATQPQ